MVHALYGWFASRVVHRLCRWGLGDRCYCLKLASSIILAVVLKVLLSKFLSFSGTISTISIAFRDFIFKRRLRM